MKPKNQININEEIPVFLFREDLQLIESIIKNELSSTSLKISLEDQEADSFAQIPSDQGSTDKINIKSVQPDVSIDIYPSSYSIYINEKNLNTEGAVYKIQAILRKRLNFQTYYSSKILLWFSILNFNIFIWSFWWAVFNLPKLANQLWLIAVLLSIITWIFEVVYPPKSNIKFINIRDSSGFFVRNKDDLIKIILTAVVSYLFGFLSH
ncbi:MAG: hypothetical protein WCV79_01100 [Candidatus Paceibacterota bacterium]|jgi:uncharacterized membrane protein (DUF485 family)